MPLQPTPQGAITTEPISTQMGGLFLEWNMPSHLRIRVTRVWAAFTCSALVGDRYLELSLPSAAITFMQFKCTIPLTAGLPWAVSWYANWNLPDTQMGPNIIIAPLPDHILTHLDTGLEVSASGALAGDQFTGGRVWYESWIDP